MFRKTITYLLFILVLGAFQVASGESCVEVDIELPSTIIPGPDNAASGYFELTNCGDEAETIMLEVEVSIDLQSFNVASTPILLGAGETISREFKFFVPQALAGYTVTLCVTATAGEAEDSDCATMTIEENGSPGGTTSKLFGFAMASEADCVDVTLELPEIIEYEPGITAEGYFELTNCGDEAATVYLSVEATIYIEGIIDETITIPDIPVNMGAGETISRNFVFPVLPYNGTYTICVTATSGKAVATSCQTVVVVGAENPGIPTQMPGILVQGTDCILFAPAGNEEMLFVLDDYGEFKVGDNVIVSGNLVIGCDTDCSDAVGCIVNNTIESLGYPGSIGRVKTKNFPNPFNPNTSISFDIPVASSVSLTIYNNLGQQVKTLVNNQILQGPQVIEWDGTDDAGRTVSSGIYFYRIDTDQEVIATKKMMMIK